MQFAPKIALTRAFWNAKWRGARVLERRGGFRAIRIALFGAVDGMGPAVWEGRVFGVLAFRAISLQLFLPWSGGPLIAKAI